MKIIFLSYMLLSVILGFTQTSCKNEVSNSSSNPTPSISKINTDKYVYITKTCAPWDGAALTILISAKPQDCDKIEAPYLRVTIWKSIANVSGKEFTFPDNKVGIISKQVEKDKYVIAKMGTIKFNKSDDKSEVVFEIDVEFEDGEKVKDKFKAKWCLSQRICG